jgi:DNA invertase Pin-like site-specific DNA recombinase
VKPIAAAIYVRISQDREGAGLGVKRQEEDCRALAKRLGWRVVDLYVDNDTSAYSGKPRKDYARLLADIETGQVTAVIAWHTDRLHRNNRELLDYIDLSVERKMPTQTVTAGPLDLSTANGRAAAITLGAWARAESEHKAERIKRAHEQAAKDGRWRGGARPFGYTADATHLEPSEARLVRAAYRSLLAGESLASIMRKWNDKGVTTTTGKAWSYATLRQLLLRPRNYGKSVLNGEVVGDGQWPPLVAEPVFRSVAAILTDSSRRTSGSTQGRWLLAGLAFCGVCNDGTTVKSATARSRGKSSIIYRCRASAHLGRRAEYCDEFVAGVILERLRRDDARDLLSANPGPDTEALRIEADSIRRQLDESASLFAEGVLTAVQLRSTTARMRERLGEVEEQMTDRSRITALAGLLGAADPEAVWESLSWAARRTAVDILCTVTIGPAGRGNARVFDPTTIRIDWRKG